jgi:hypothetical protein
MELRGNYNVATITTTELINKIFSFCQVYSGVEFFPYQAQFGKRIIRSILENDGDEITALFSRQCIEANQLVHMADGTKKCVKDVKIGDKVLSFDYNAVVEREVINSYHVGKREVYRLRLQSGDEILCTPNHRFLSRDTRLFKEISRFECGEEIAYINKDGKRRFSAIKSLKFINDMDTYDIEVESAENFFCNNFLVHNSGKSETVATISGGLAIILPILANLPMFVTDKRLQEFKTGLLLGIFAPTLRQAQISFSRMKKRMGSKHAQEIMQDPEINVSFDVSNGQNILLSNGSLICCQSASEGSNIEGDSYMVIIVDEAQDVGNFKYAKSISPMGAFYNATKILIGTSTTQRGFFYDSIQRNKTDYENGLKRNHFEYDYHTVIKYNPKYEKYVEGEKKRQGETSDEFQMAFCLKWILERGMFIDPKVFDSLAMPEAGTYLADTTKSHVAGIDLGKKMDSTVVTVIEVDWENPIIVERSKDLDVPDYIVYDVYVKAWLEIQGDNWNEQYDIIKDFLSNYNMARVVMDATGVGDAIYDRLKANVDYEVLPFVFGASQKSDLYKHLNTEIRAKRVHYPANEEVRDSLEFGKFIQQFYDLEKSYRGQQMVVAHPDVAGAHDDYPDSLALAVWGAMGDPISKPVTEKQNLYEGSGSQFINAKNQFTARRRR